MVTQSCSIAATNFTTPHDVIFPHKPGIVMIPEVSLLATTADKLISALLGVVCLRKLFVPSEYDLGDLKR